MPSRGSWHRVVVTALGLFAGATFLPTPVQAQGTETRVMIRAVAHDAKLIGSGVGGARITVVHALTGDVLAQGLQEGGTGDTRAIMMEPRERGESIYDTEGAAGYLAELVLEGPTRVRIEAEGPLGTPHATQRASRTMDLVPGKHVLGDGVVIELYGFTVELLEPTENPSEFEGESMPVRARVTMLCGCPTEPGGIWDSDDYTIEARIVDAEGRVLESAPLGFAGETSEYEGEIAVPEGDGLSLQVLAMDAGTANFGMVARDFDELGAGQGSE